MFCSWSQTIQISENFTEASAIISLLLLMRFCRIKLWHWDKSKFRKGYSLFKLSYLLVKTVHTIQYVFWLGRHRGFFSSVGFWLPLARALPAKKKDDFVSLHTQSLEQDQRIQPVLSYFFFSLFFLFLSLLLYF